MSEIEIIPLPAATVTLVRDSARGPEVLMMQRNLQSGFVPGAHIFPGGALDKDDAAADYAALADGVSDAQANAALGLDAGGLAYWVAAIRECFEEAGLLLAYAGGRAMLALDAAGAAQRFHAHRHALNAGERDFLDVLRAEGLRLAVDQLVYFAHWITPVGAPRRYDTRFFVAAAPAAQEPLHDNQETISSLWVRPAEALDHHRAGRFEMRLPTVRTLEEFAAFDRADALLAAMRAKRDITSNLPRIARAGNYLVPGDPGYEAAALAENRGKWTNR